MSNDAPRKEKSPSPQRRALFNSIEKIGEKLAILRDGAIMQARVLHLLLLKEGPRACSQEIGSGKTGRIMN